jgi:uncharacterized membrane protein YqaE (UPF0057 family)
MKYLFCIILPPVACLMVNRKIAALLNVFLTICFWVPGVIHAFFVVTGAEADKRNKDLIRAIERSERSNQGS